jgi:hypothetical protein
MILNNAIWRKDSKCQIAPGWKPQDHSQSFPCFHLIKEVEAAKSLAPVRQWLTNHPWGEGCRLTYFQTISFAQTQKSSNLRNQWLSFLVLRKPISFHLLNEICASELACCYLGFNDLDLLSLKGTVSGRDRLNTFIKTLLCWKFCVEFLTRPAPFLISSPSYP